jgi:hypothetical protein
MQARHRRFGTIGLVLLVVKKGFPVKSIVKPSGL